MFKMCFDYIDLSFFRRVFEGYYQERIKAKMIIIKREFFSFRNMIGNNTFLLNFYV